jgi:hypothetical protein
LVSYKFFFKKNFFFSRQRGRRRLEVQVQVVQVQVVQAVQAAYAA